MMSDMDGNEKDYYLYDKNEEECLITHDMNVQHPSSQLSVLQMQ